MRTFAKAQAASFIASGVDYTVTIFAVEWLAFNYLFGSTTGTVAGGLICFSLSRNWVFHSRAQDKKLQLAHYTIVWLGYLFLITNGVFLLTQYLHINYIISKGVISLVLAFFYNYPLQRRFVFYNAK